MALVDSITEALDKAQSSVVHHPKLIKSLKTLHDQSVLVEFFEAFVQPLMAALVIFKKEPVVERVLEFVAKFSASVTPLDPAPGGDEELIGEGRALHAVYVCSVDTSTVPSRALCRLQTS